MRFSRIVSTAALVAVSVGAAEAGGFAVREQSAYGQGSSFAGMAAPGDSISSMFWNPAAVTTATSTTLEGNVTGVFPRSELDADLSRSTLANPLLGGITGDGGDVGEIGIVPGTYFATPITDQLYFGVSVNAPYGLGTTSDAPWVGQFSHLDAEVMSVNVSPVIGVKINDMISVAAGLQVQYFDVDIETALSLDASSRQRLKGDDDGIGFVAGVTLTPFDGTIIGIGYRSAVKHTLDGSQAFDIPVAGGLIQAGRYPISADITLPETVSVGLRQEINESFTLMAGMEWANWSRIQTVPFDGSRAGTALALEYEDGWFFSVGGEYKFNPNWTFRGGLGYEIAPTTDEDRSMRLPDADRIWASIGASYNWNERLSVDFGYSHLFVDDAPVDETTVTSSGPIRYAGTAEGSVDIISFGLRYKFGG